MITIFIINQAAVEAVLVATRQLATANDLVFGLNTSSIDGLHDRL
jgi:hypothetical protein